MTRLFLTDVEARVVHTAPICVTEQDSSFFITRFSVKIAGAAAGD